MLRCANCNKVLTQADSICTECDEQLAMDADAPVPPGKHHCPVCQRSFGKPAVVLWPVTAKWYMPQVDRLQCPHCKVLLLDRRSLRLPPWQLILFVVVTLFAQLGLPANYARVVLITLILICLALILRQRTWRVPDSQRYVQDEA